MIDRIIVDRIIFLIEFGGSFLYGWIMKIERLSEVRDQMSGVRTNYYTWGLDLSGTLQGAGGIGGLLSCSSCSASGTETYYPVTDANGNITEYVTTNGTIAAHYEYNPFGGTITSSGTKANDFHFRFSTKYLDDETGLYNYGLRDLDVELGRWISRDPIGEVSIDKTIGLLKKINILYGFTGNSSIARWDYLGKDWYSELEKKKDIIANWLKLETYSNDEERNEWEKQIDDINNQLKRADLWSSCIEFSFYMTFKRDVIISDFVSKIPFIPGDIIDAGCHEIHAKISVKESSKCKDVKVAVSDLTKNLKVNLMIYVSFGTSSKIQKNIVSFHMPMTAEFQTLRKNDNVIRHYYQDLGKILKLRALIDIKEKNFPASPIK